MDGDMDCEYAGRTIETNDDIASCSSWVIDEKEYRQALSVFDRASDLEVKSLKIHYERLFKWLNESKEENATLRKSNDDLRVELKFSTETCNSLAIANSNYQNNIRVIKRESENAWDNLEKTNERDRKSVSTISELKTSLGEIKSEIVDSKNIIIDKETIIAELKDNICELQNKLVNQQLIVDDLDKQKRCHEKENDDLIQRVHILQNKNTSLEHLSSQKSEDTQREKKRRECVHSELCSIQDTLNKERAEHQKTKEEATTLKDLLKNQSSQVRKVTQLYEEEKQRYLCLEKKLQMMTTKNSDLKLENKTILDSLYESHNCEKRQSNKVDRLTLETLQLQKKLDRDRTNALRYQRLIYDQKQSMDLTCEENKLLHKEVDRLKRCDEQMRIDVRTLVQERSVNQGRLQKSEQKLNDADAQVSQKSYEIKSLEREVKAINDQKTMLSTEVGDVEHEKKRLMMEITSLKRQIDLVLDEVKAKTNQVNEFKRIIQEWQKKFKSQKQEHDKIKNNRNRTLKHLNESAAEVEQLQARNNVLMTEIEQLKDEIIVKDSAYVKACYGHKNDQAHAEKYQKDASRVREILETNDDTINKQNSEIKKMASMITSMDDNARKSRHDNEKLQNERDVLGTQLIRSRDTNALLCEKVKIQSDMLKRGEAQYRERINDIKILKLKLKDTMHKLNLSASGKANIEELQLELLRKQKELFEEKTKIKILSEELENPLNVHRWRRLEGRDPSSFELIHKVGSLQKRLLQKNELIMQKDVLCLEQQQQNEKLKITLERRCSDNMGDDKIQLNVLKNAVKEKTRQLQAQTGELNMIKAQSDQIKHELGIAKRQISKQKTRFEDSVMNNENWREPKISGSEENFQFRKSHWQTNKN